MILDEPGLRFISLFDKVDPDYLKACKEKSIRTGAALLKMMNNGLSGVAVHDRRLLIVEEEWSKMLLNLSMRDNPLAQDLIDFKDKGAAEKNVQSEGLSYEANEVHVSIIGNIQDAVLNHKGKEIQQLLDIGFMNRMLHVKTLLRTSSVDLPILEWKSDEFKDLINKWKKAVERATDIGEITITPDAKRLWKKWNSGKTKGALNSVKSKMNPNVRKLTARNGYLGTQLQVVLALLDGVDEIMIQHVNQSFDMMDFNNKSINGIYSKLGSSPTESLTQRILSQFEGSPYGKLTKTELHNKNQNFKAGQLNEVIKELEDSKLIVFDPDTRRQNRLRELAGAGNKITMAYILRSKLEAKEKHEDLI